MQQQKKYQQQQKKYQQQQKKYQQQQKNQKKKKAPLNTVVFSKIQKNFVDPKDGDNYTPCTPCWDYNNPNIILPMIIYGIIPEGKNIRDYIDDLTMKGGEGITDVPVNKWKYEEMLKKANNKELQEMLKIVKAKLEAMPNWREVHGTREWDSWNKKNKALHWRIDDIEKKIKKIEEIKTMREEGKETAELALLKTYLETLEKERETGKYAKSKKGEERDEKENRWETNKIEKKIEVLSKGTDGSGWTIEDLYQAEELAQPRGNIPPFRR